MGRGLADLLDDSARPPPLVLAFAALQVGGDSDVNHHTVDLEPVPIGLASCGRSSHEREYDWVESFSQTNWSPAIGSGFLLRLQSVGGRTAHRPQPGRRAARPLVNYLISPKLRN